MQGAASVTPELVAIITAALSCALDAPAGGFVIRSITPVAGVPGGGVWAKAGVLEQHMVRRLGPRG